MDFINIVPMLAWFHVLFQTAASSDLCAPTLTIQPSYPEYFEGEKIVLTCSAFQNRTVEGYRFFNRMVKGFRFFNPEGQIIHKMAADPFQKGKLTFKVQMDSGGNYSCDCWMEEGGEVTSPRSNGIFIHVNEAPAAPSLSAHPKLHAYYLGDSISLWCTAPPGEKEVKEFQYYGDRKIVSAMASHNNIYMYNMSILESKDIGVFKCAYITQLSERKVLSKESNPVSIDRMGVRWQRMLAVDLLIHAKRTVRASAPSLANGTINNCVHTSGNGTLLSSSTSSVTGVVFLLLAATIGLPGNLFVIWSILWKMKSSQRSVTCLLVLNLAMADSVVLLLTPFFVIFLIFKNWLFGWAICKGVYYLCCINMFASIFIITLMSIDRCLAVNQPYFSQAIRKKRLVVKVLAGIWVAAIFLSIPAFLFRQVLKEPSKGHYICEPCHARPSLAIFHFSLETVMAFIIPFTIIVGCYSAILIRLRGVKRRRGARTEKLIVAIVICFTVLWVPYHIVNMIQVSSNLASGKAAERLGRAWKSGRAGATALAFLSSSINPVLYVFAAGNLIKTSGANFIAQFFEGASDGLGRRSQSQKNLAKDLVGATVNMGQQPLGHCDGVNKATESRLGDGTNEQPLCPG